MKGVSWREIAEGAGVIAIVASLIFVGMQLKQSEQIGISDVIANKNERTNALRQQIIENASIWHKACAGEKLNPAERHVATAIFATYSDNLLSAWLTSGGGLIRTESLRGQIVHNAALQLWNFPGLTDLYNTHQSMRQGPLAMPIGKALPELQQRIRDQLKRFADSGVEPALDIAWCGLT